MVDTHVGVGALLGEWTSHHFGTLEFTESNLDGTLKGTIKGKDKSYPIAGRISTDGSTLTFGFTMVFGKATIGNVAIVRSEPSLHIKCHYEYMDKLGIVISGHYCMFKDKKHLELLHSQGLQHYLGSDDPIRNILEEGEK